MDILVMSNSFQKVDFIIYLKLLFNKKDSRKVSMQVFSIKLSRFLANFLIHIQMNQIYQSDLMTKPLDLTKHRVHTVNPVIFRKLQSFVRVFHSRNIFQK